MRTYTIHHTHYTFCFAALLLVALLFFPACSDSNEPDSAAGQASGAVAPTPVPMTPTLSYLLTNNNTKLVITGTAIQFGYENATVSMCALQIVTRNKDYGCAVRLAQDVN